MIETGRFSATVHEAEAFRFAADTNGGSNAFGFDPDANEFTISGQGVSGTERFDDLRSFMDRAADLYNGTSGSGGTINALRIANGDFPNIRTVTQNNAGDWVVKVSGSGVGGAATWVFDTQAEANTFNTFITDVFNRINASDAIAVDDTAGTNGDAIISATGNVDFADVDLSDAHTVSITPTPGPGQLYRGEIEAVISDVSTGDGEGAIRWTYTVADDDLNDLEAGETLTQTYTLTVSDGLETDSRTVTITIVSSNDAPRAGGKVTANIVEQTDTLDLSSAPTVITFTDPDLNETGHTATLSFKSSSGVTSGIAGLTPGELEDLVDLSPVTKAAGSSSGSLEAVFTAPSTLIDYLAAGEVLTINYRVTITDSQGASTGKDYQVKITGTNDAPVIEGGPVSVSLDEAADVAGADGQGNLSGTMSGSLSFTDVDVTDTQNFRVVPTVSVSGPTGGLSASDFQTAVLAFMSVAGSVSSSSADTGGSLNWVFDADEDFFDYLTDGQSVEITYVVEVSDGKGGATTETITVTVNGATDVLFTDHGETVDLGDMTADDAQDDNYLNALDGDDTVWLPNAGDALEGEYGPGNVFHAGGGDDTVYGGDLDDQIDGDSGNDELRGGDGNDSISGGAGEDLIFGDDGDDKLRFGGDIVSH